MSLVLLVVAAPLAYRVGFKLGDGDFQVFGHDILDHHYVYKTHSLLVIGMLMSTLLPACLLWKGVRRMELVEHCHGHVRSTHGTLRKIGAGIAWGTGALVFLALVVFAVLPGNQC